MLFDISRLFKAVVTSLMLIFSLATTYAQNVASFSKDTLELSNTPCTDTMQWQLPQMSQTPAEYETNLDVDARFFADGNGMWSEDHGDHIHDYVSQFQEITSSDQPDADISSVFFIYAQLTYDNGGITYQAEKVTFDVNVDAGNTFGDQGYQDRVVKQEATPIKVDKAEYIEVFQY